MVAPLIPPPPPTVPIGRTLNGTAVYIDNAWARYLGVDLLARVGGMTAPTLTEVYNIASRPAPYMGHVEEADVPLVIPGPQGVPGDRGPMGMMWREETETPVPMLPGHLMNMVLSSGTYTPTLTNVLNLDGSTAFQCQYLQVGSVVTVSGKFNLDPTAGAAITRLVISLPVASNFGAAEDLGGVAFAIGVAGQGAGIIADTANDRAQVNFISGDTTNQAMYFIFQYEVI